MNRIPEEEIARVKRETDIVAIIQSRGIELKRQGKNWVGFCPFHDDKNTPNLIVTPSKGLFRCMACEATGNVIQFVQKHDGISFRHAFELLTNDSPAAFAQIEGPKKDSTVTKLPCPIEPGSTDAETLSAIVTYYHERLLINQSARDYLKSRRLDEEELLKYFRVGFADRTLGLRLPKKNRKSGAELRGKLQRLGIYRPNGREHLNGCVTFPIADPTTGEIRQIYGRRIDPKAPKQNRHLYLPHEITGIFNPYALTQPQIILTEGIMDALSFYVSGLKNVTCAYSSSALPDELFEEIVAAKIQSVHLAFDADEAGEKATQAALTKLQSLGIECFRIRFPWGSDANACLVSDGPDTLNLAYRSAEWLGHEPTSSLAATPLAAAPLVAGAAATEATKKKTPTALPKATRSGEHWLLNLDSRGYRICGLERNPGLDSLKITLRLWANDLFHLDTLDLCNDAHRRKYIGRAAEETRLEPELIKRDLAKLLLVLEGLQEDRLRSDDQPSQNTPEMTPEQRKEAEELLQSKDLITRIETDFETCGIVGEKNNAIAGYLSCTSRLLDRPLAVIIQSTSAAGKTTLMEAVLAFFPEEERIKYSAMTGQSLYYLGETNIKHKILAIVEEEGAERASYALKLLQSEGELTIASTGKNPKTGQMETQTYRVQGPVMIFLTTTATDIDEELQNRCLTLSVDETQAQTKRIHTAQRKARTLEGIMQKAQKTHILQTHQNAQRLLESYPIWNPYVEQLTFTDQRTRTRRDHEKYLTLIDSITLLHQKQRKLIERPLPNGKSLRTLVTEIDDIAIANRLAPEILGRSLDELPPQTRKLWAEIKKLVLEKSEHKNWTRITFTRRDIRSRIGWSVTQTRLHLDRLVEHEYLNARAGRNGLRYEYVCLIDPTTPDTTAHIGLIDITQLHPYDPNLAEQKGNLSAPDKNDPSGSKPQ